LKARTEQFLYVLLWSADQLTRPTFRNLDPSFEGWAYRNGLLNHIAYLEKKRFLERRGKTDRIYRLTEKGRLRVLGGRDPQVQWARPWDGWWRVVCFDVPRSENRQRRRLRQYLRNQGFGLLQDSVWLTPDPLDEQKRLLRSIKPDAESLVLLRARACGGESDNEIVAGAWNFRRINDLYRQHLKILDQMPLQKVRTPGNASALLKWSEAERTAWNDAMATDPLLPKRLLPDSYLGCRSWERRRSKLKRALTLLSNLNLA
jgi:phenylacetic acid degradation operon negative regulatory protein